MHKLNLKWGKHCVFITAVPFICQIHWKTPFSFAPLLARETDDLKTFLFVSAKTLEPLVFFFNITVIASLFFMLIAFIQACDFLLIYFPPITAGSSLGDSAVCSYAVILVWPPFKQIMRSNKTNLSLNLEIRRNVPVLWFECWFLLGMMVTENMLTQV